MVQREKVILSVIFLCVLGILGLTIYTTNFLTPQLQNAEDALQKESYQLATYSGATLTDCKIIRKNKSLLISRSYATDQHWINLHEFYVKEAKKNDWQLVIDGTISEPAEEDKDLLVFRKADYELTITINTTEVDSSFQVELFWAGLRRRAPLWGFPYM
ncbi:hypothetical protein [Anaerospora hongkongensis]|uniref:hypothetical protein n=1 Tax=Anaerospora hongkongensis TaxID=244830 RepID=UPI00289975A6|nr:hypothetical protein [Anaerospora hongkongensis]